MTMAAAGPIHEHPDYNTFLEIRKWFFVKLPVREIMRKRADWLRKLLPEDQKKLLDYTVRSDICKEFPVAFDYQQKFMKSWVQIMEDNNSEVEDVLYETYTTLISAQSVHQEINYKTFILPDGKELILEESVNMLSHGTTGLQIWPAAFWLAEWILENKEEFKNRCVLELGCGLGFTGLVASMCCEVKEYILTDWHVKVLQSLFNNLCLNLRRKTCDGCTLCKECFQKVDNSSSENWDTACNVMKYGTMDGTEKRTKSNHDVNEMELNLNEEEETAVEVNNKQECRQKNMKIEGSIHKKSASDLGDGHVDGNIFEGDYCRTVGKTVDCLNNLEKYENSEEKVHKHWKNASRMHFAALDWEEEHNDIKLNVSPDIILAADVIFDPKLISPFMETLRAFFNNSTRHIAVYVASSVRNQQTFDQFVEEIGAADFDFEEIPGPSLEVFVYDRSCPMKLLKLMPKHVMKEDTLR